MFSHVFYLTVIVSGTLGLDWRPGGRFSPGGPRPGGTRPWRSSSACWRYCSCCLSYSHKHSFISQAKRNFNWPFIRSSMHDSQRCPLNIYLCNDKGDIFFSVLRSVETWFQPVNKKYRNWTLQIEIKIENIWQLTSVFSLILFKTISCRNI